MPELLLEVGTEELPATSVRRAYTELGAKIVSLLVEARVLGHDAQATVFGTPRRLIVSVAEVSPSQEDSSVEVRGPGAKAAYDGEGKPSPALLGFCRGQGVEPNDVRSDGQYVWVTRHVKGQPTAELLKEVLPKAIRSLTFDKSMRWGSSRMRFARPLRWILAAFDEGVVEFEIEGVKSGLTSYGHRFYSPKSFTVSNLESLTSGLRSRFVEVDPERRRSLIVDGANQASSGTPDLPEALVDENVFLCEWPTAIAGHFLPDFMELPAPVLITAMAKHERMFPVRAADGNLTNQFVFVRNSGVDDAVRSGCEWVLNARFNDAKFFFDEDRKLSLEQFLEKTSGILFQAKLGTVRQRAARLEELCGFVAAATGADGSEVALARQAGLYAKADLSSGLVSELASLQGVVGGHYARSEGFAEPVCHALATQYDLSKNSKPDGEGSRTAVRLVIADQLDKLAGYLGIELEPTGSSDPFALRRAASQLIEAAWSWPSRIPPFEGFFEHALDLYEDQGVAMNRDFAISALHGLFSSRYPTLMSGIRYDVLEAAMLTEHGWQVTAPQQVRFRARVMERLAEEVPFVQTATRPINLVSAARKKGIEYGTEDPLSRLEHAALESAEGLELFELASEQDALLLQASETEQDEDVIRLLMALQDPINRFFDNTMVMVDEPEVRYARLTLLQAVSQQLLVAGDFSKIVIEG